MSAARTILPPCEVPAGPVDSGAQWQQQHPSWLYRGILAAAVTDRDSDEPWPVEVQGLGAIPVPDGRLVACDPYLAEADQPPFLDAVPAGDHEVYVAIATVGPDHARVAAALIVFGPGPVGSWRLAGVGDEDDVDELPIGEFLGYGVDAGTGCFASGSAMPALAEVLGEDGGMLEDPMSEAMEQSAINAVIASPRDGAPAIAAFTSGWGDGFYPTWLGLDDAGSIVLAMTDFLVAGDPYDDDNNEPTGPETEAPVSAQDVPAPGRLSRLFGRR